MEGQQLDSFKGIITVLESITQGQGKVITREGHIYNITGAVALGNYLSVAGSWRRVAS